MIKAPQRFWMIVVTLAMIVVLFAPEAGAGGRRLVAHLSEPFVVQDQVHPPGTICVKQLLEYSPVATLHQIEIDGRAVGYVLAQETDRVEKSRTDELIFVRDTSGRLVLEAVALSGEPVRELRALTSEPSLTVATVSRAAEATSGTQLEIARALAP